MTKRPSILVSHLSPALQRQIHLELSIKSKSNLSPKSVRANVIKEITTHLRQNAKTFNGDTWYVLEQPFPAQPKQVYKLSPQQVAKAWEIFVDFTCKQFSQTIALTWRSQRALQAYKVPRVEFFGPCNKWCAIHLEELHNPTLKQSNEVCSADETYYEALKHFLDDLQICMKASLDNFLFNYDLYLGVCSDEPFCLEASASSAKAYEVFRRIKLK